MPRVGVLLSGCGVQDGSEIYEAVLTLLALERAGATVLSMAPDIEQAHVVNHYRGDESRQEGSRNVLTEAARIVRGEIISTHEISAHDLDALIIIGGYGVTKNLCNYSTMAEAATVNPDVERLIRELNGLGKPIGAMCAGTILVALALRDKRVTMTMGTDGAGLMRMNAHHMVTNVDQAYVDEQNNVVSTAAFLMAQTPLEAEAGINKLVAEVLRRAEALGTGDLTGHTVTTTTGPATTTGPVAL
jgi:enhancing lycopene biosynthesis protein 2